MRKCLVLAILGLAFWSTGQAQAQPGELCRKSDSALAPTQEEPLWLGGGISARANCTAQCIGGTKTVSCSGTCTAVDANCPSHAGFVICNGVYSYCPTPCPTPQCEEVNGTSCSVQGSSKACYWPDGSQYECDCFFGEWNCPY